MPLVPSKGVQQMNIRSIRLNGTLSVLLALVLAGGIVVNGAPKPKNLVMQVHEVKCWDETTGKYREKFGVDTMRLTAIAIGPTGVVERNKIHKLGDFAKDGVLKQFDPPRKLATFALNNNLPLPILYQAVLVLAENDPGNGLNAQIDNFVKQGSAAALAKAKSIGAMTLDAVPTVVASGNVTLETFAAEVAKKVLTAKATVWFKDDVFPPSLQGLRIDKKDFTWTKGKMESPRQKVVFKGLQGKYHVIYSWKLI